MNASNHQTFFSMDRYAVVGHHEKRPFPKLTYGGLKALGKTVFPIDSSSLEVEGDPTYPDFAALPEQVQGVVIEVPREESASWIERAAEAGVKDVWLHMGTDTPEAHAAAAKHGINMRHGTCAVMYVRGGFPHSVHRFIRKALGRY
jgi:hypothetical protein